MKLYSALFLLIFSLAGRAQRKGPLNIAAELHWKENKSLCADYLYADSLGYLCLLSGCEARVQVLINRYTVKGDTILVQPFDFNSEEVFLDIINQTGTGTIKLPRGQYSGVEVMKLEMIFGVPVVFWIDRAYDYKVRINVPAYVLNNYILSCFNFKAKFLLKDKATIYYQKKKLKILPGPAVAILSPSF